METLEKSTHMSTVFTNIELKIIRASTLVNLV